MTALYKPTIRLLNEGDGWSKKDWTPAYAPYECGYTPLTNDPVHRYWTWGVWATLSHVGHEILDELIADGWEPWSEETRPYFFSARNQGAHILRVEEASFKTQEWVRTEDIHFARRYPVALAHRAARSESEKEMFSRIRIGSCALIDDHDHSCVYSLEQLRQHAEAKELCDIIHEGLKLALEGTPAARCERWAQTHKAAKRLAILYWELHQMQRPPDARSRQNVRAETLPMIPSVIRDRAMLTAIGSPMEALLAAYSDGQEGARHWLGREEQAIPTYTHQSAHGKTQLQLRPSDEKAPGQRWDEVGKLSDYDGDVLLILAAQQIMGKPDERGYVWISSKAILDYRGIEPIWKKQNGKVRRAGHRTEDQEKIAAIMARMVTSWVRVEEWIIMELACPGTTKQKCPAKKKRVLYTREDRLLDVGSVIRQKGPSNRDAMATQGRNGTPVAWKYRLGSWIDPFLSGANSQVAWLFQQALKYDPYRHGQEKRLARHLSWHFLRHARPDGIEPLLCRVNDILTITKIVPDERYPGRARTRLEDVLKRLKEDGLISTWFYGSVRGENSGMRKKHWLPVWLMMVVRIEIHPPASPLALREIPLSPRTEGTRDR